VNSTPKVFNQPPKSTTIYSCAATCVHHLPATNCHCHGQLWSSKWHEKDGEILGRFGKQTGQPGESKKYERSPNEQALGSLKRNSRSPYEHLQRGPAAPKGSLSCKKEERHDIIDWGRNLK
jgi:hypothetical protein